MCASMKRASFPWSDFTLSEYAKSIGPSRLPHRPLRVLPAQLRERPGAPARVRRLRARRRALQRALHHALQDRGDAKQVVGEIEAPVLDSCAPRAGAVCRNVPPLAGNAERGEVQPRDAAELPRRNVPAHAVIGKIRERMAERGKLPVED